MIIIKISKIDGVINF